MMLAKVIGNVVSTIKEPTYKGFKTLWVQPIDPEGNPRGDAIMTFDAVDAGIGDQVLVVQEGGSAMLVMGVTPPAPVQSAIVAVVDHVRLKKTEDRRQKTEGLPDSSHNP